MHIGTFLLPFFLYKLAAFLCYSRLSYKTWPFSYKSSLLSYYDIPPVRYAINFVSRSIKSAISALLSAGPTFGQKTKWRGSNTIFAVHRTSVRRARVRRSSRFCGVKSETHSTLYFFFQILFAQSHAVIQKYTNRQDGLYLTRRNKKIIQ